MGVIWSSPYRLQVFVICLGLLLLTSSFVLLLLSIGLADFHWRLVGGLCASTGSALLVIGTCWCVWVVRRGRFAHGTLRVGMAPDSEAQTLTSDATWREEAGLTGLTGPGDDILGGGHHARRAGDFEEEDDDEEDDDDDENDDDVDDSDEEDGADADDDEEKDDEEEDSFESDVCSIDKRYRLQDLSRRTMNGSHLERFGEGTSGLRAKEEEEESRLIPV